MKQQIRKRKPIENDRSPTLQLLSSFDRLIAFREYTRRTKTLSRRVSFVAICICLPTQPNLTIGLT